MIIRTLIKTCLFLWICIPGASAQLVEQWTATYDGQSVEQALGIVLDNTENIYVIGTSGLSGSHDFLTVKYNINGDTLWTDKYNSPFNQEDYIEGYTLDELGNIYVAGVSLNSNNGDFFTIKYNSNGDTIWTARYNGPWDNNDHLHAIAADTAYVYVTGSIVGPAIMDCATIKYDASTGDTVWVARYNGAGNSHDATTEIALDNWGNIYVAGYTRNGINLDYLVIKYNTWGDTVWTATYDGTGNGTDQVRGIAINDQGNVCITGSSHNGNDNDIATVMYDSSGNILWTARHNGPDDKNDAAELIAFDDSGSVYIVGGGTYDSTYYDFIVLKYNEQGDTIWTARFDGSSNGQDYATAIVLDSLGNLYVAGYIQEIGIHSDIGIVKYAPDGSFLWYERYNGSANLEDYVSGITKDNSGNLFITGYTNNGVDFDFLTIKYCTDIPITTVSKDTGICQGDSIQLTSSSPNNFYWSPATGLSDSTSAAPHAFPDSTTTYAFIASTDCTVDTAYVTVSVDPVPVADFTFSDTGYTVVFTDASSHATNWQWDFGDGSTSDMRNPVHHYDDYGSFEVCLTTDNACGSDTTCKTILVIDTATTLITHAHPYLVMVYPNPFSKVTSFRLPIQANENYTLDLYDICGKIVSQTPVRATSFQLERGELPAGLYIYKIRSDRQVLAMGKLCIQD